MAALQERNGSYRVLFRHNGKQHTFTLGPVSQSEAETKAAHVNYLLMRLNQRLLVLPDGVDIVTFVRHDGNPPATGPVLPATPRRVVTLARLRDEYLETHGNGTVEANTLYTMGIHFAHVCRVLGEGCPVGDVSVARLQEYVNARAKKVSPATIRKELATLRAAWNWGGPMGLTDGRLPLAGVRYPKADEKPAYMTREEIERQLRAGGDPEALWEALYLKAEDVADLLALVRNAATHPWFHPLVCFAAHTGARRSELLRAVVADVDLDANTVVIREKKRVRGVRTTRRVPLTPFLKGVLDDWLKVHPGGPHLFCHAGVVARSKKRGRTTGHRSGRGRPTTRAGRLATVRVRTVVGPTALTRNEVHTHFKAVFRGSKWEPVRGLHTLRHSFLSACASKAVDQRLVEEWCGHQDGKTSARYRHLWPSTQQEAIKQVF
jgi:integrase